MFLGKLLKMQDLKSGVICIWEGARQVRMMRGLGNGRAYMQMMRELEAFCLPATLLAIMQPIYSHPTVIYHRPGREATEKLRGEKKRGMRKAECPPCHGTGRGTRQAGASFRAEEKYAETQNEAKGL